MPSFSRPTIIAALSTLHAFTHAEFGLFILEHGLEDTEANVGSSVSVKKRTNAVIAYLLRNPDALHHEGGNLTDTLLRDLVERAIVRAGTPTPANLAPSFEQMFPTLSYALKRDGFQVRDGQLRPALPEVLDLPQADDEVHALLRKFGFFDPALGHLDQAIANHASGNWAAANGQLRAFMESLFDEIAQRLAPNPGSLPPAGQARRVWLATGVAPPFLLPALNEWDDQGQGKGFVEGFYRRLHPAGSHPGLSDEEDCTFRLHLVLLLARLLLRRLDARLGQTR